MKQHKVLFKFFYANMTNIKIKQHCSNLEDSVSKCFVFEKLQPAAVSVTTHVKISLIFQTKTT